VLCYDIVTLLCQKCGVKTFVVKHVLGCIHPSFYGKFWTSLSIQVLKYLKAKEELWKLVGACDLRPPWFMF
jgi:hypothetical protein